MFCLKYVKLKKDQVTVLAKQICKQQKMALLGNRSVSMAKHFVKRQYYKTEPFFLLKRSPGFVWERTGDLLVFSFIFSSIHYCSTSKY
jgi:hypothetical protein